MRDIGLSQPELEDYARRSGAFESIAGIWPITANLTGSDRPERVEVLLASANYFDVLGVGAGARPRRSRARRDSRHRDGGRDQRRAVAARLRRAIRSPRPQAPHRRRRLRNHRRDAAVVPPSHADTRDRHRGVGADAAGRKRRSARPSYSARFMPAAIGRVTRGMSIDAARAGSRTWAQSWCASIPTSIPTRLGWTPRVHPLAADLVATVRPALLVLMARHRFVMLIAISNISNLLLIRAVAREREIAVQRALGASRWRIISGVLVEGGVLALAGGALGFLASLWGVDLLLRLVPDRLPRVADIAVDASRLPVRAADRRGRRPAGRSRSGAAVGAHRRQRSPEVVRQGRARRHARPRCATRWSSRRSRSRSCCSRRRPAGAQPLEPAVGRRPASPTSELLTLRVWLPQPNDPSAGPYFEHPKRVALIRGVLERLGRVGATIRHAGSDDRAAGDARQRLSGICRRGLDAGSQRPGDGDVHLGHAGLLSRRSACAWCRAGCCDEQDDERAPRAAVINETLAKTYFRGEDPSGGGFTSSTAAVRSRPTRRGSPSSGSSRDVKEDAHRRARAPADLPVAAAVVDAVAGGRGERPGCTAVRRGGRSRRCSRSIRTCRSMRCAPAKSSSPRSSRSAASRRA